MCLLEQTALLVARFLLQSERRYLMGILFKIVSPGQIWLFVLEMTHNSNIQENK